MGAERWSAVRALFERALEAGGEEREKLLAGCPDESVREEVRRLLAAATRPTTKAALLDEGLSQRLLVPLALGAAERLVGQEVAGYRIIAVLGEGGMGTVYRAEQQSLRREVALKLMQAGLQSEPARRRFAYEAETLGRLVHPQIAQVYEAGVWEGPGLDVPFFAMELVPGGLPIDRFARERGLDTRGKVRLMEQVCGAVHFGHQRGVLHRDLKPANVLVDPEGRPKVIDFGIARALGDGAAAEGRTAPGVLLGTLQYMSPEQCGLGEHDVDARSDVHALGLILYELLAGRPAYPVAGLGPLQATRVLREHEPMPPSRVLGDASLRELDWIAGKAMQKERERRYAAASELRADLLRFLEGEPVQAAPPGRIYRLKKLAARHRAGVAAGAAVLLAILGGGIAATVGFVRASAARREAEAEASSLAELNRFLEGMIGSVHPERDGRDVRVVEVLDGAAERAEDLLADRPRIAISLLGTLGMAWHRLGLSARAKELLGRAQALALARLGPEDPTHALARHNLGTVETALGEHAAAEEHLRAALAWRVVHLGERHHDTVQTRTSLGQSLLRQQRGAQAEPELQRAWQDAGALATVEERVTIGVSLAAARQALGKQQEALALAVEMDALAARDLPAGHPVALNAAAELAVLQQEQGREEAAGTLARVLAAQELALGERHPTTTMTRSNLAAVLHGLGRFAEAEPLFRRSIELFAGPATGEDGILLRSNLGFVLEKQGKAAQAEAVLRPALRDAEQHLGRTHWLTGVVHKNLGVALKGLARFDEAEQELLAAHACLEQALGASHPNVKRTALALADFYAERRRDEDAERWRARAR
jgi:tetratricopeptide (TPR) repeat protein